MGKKSPKTDASTAAAAPAADMPLSAAEMASPVLRAVGKRMRAAKKKMNRINLLEQSRADGKELNADQVHRRRSCDHDLHYTSPIVPVNAGRNAEHPVHVRFTVRPSVPAFYIIFLCNRRQRQQIVNCCVPCQLCRLVSDVCHASKYCIKLNPASYCPAITGGNASHESGHTGCYRGARQA